MDITTIYNMITIRCRMICPSTKNDGDEKETYEVYEVYEGNPYTASVPI
jgi:hypothetical protein